LRFWLTSFAVRDSSSRTAFGLEYAFKDAIIGSNFRWALLMRPFLFSAALILIASSNVHATEALVFNGGGYTIHIVIGLADDPVIAQVHFTPLGAKDWVSLPRNLLRIEKFDMEKRILAMRFSNKNNPDLPASFSLSVKKSKAVLSISGKEIQGDEEFNWDI
jgi:hypothetical protein